MTWWKATLFYGVKCGRVNTDEELFDVVIWEVTKMTVLYNNMVLGMTLKKHVASMPECVCGRCQQLNELVPSVTMHWMAFCFWGTPQHGNRPQTNTHTRCKYSGNTPKFYIQEDWVKYSECWFLSCSCSVCTHFFILNVIHVCSAAANPALLHHSITSQWVRLQLMVKSEIMLLLHLKEIQTKAALTLYWKWAVFLNLLRLVAQHQHLQLIYNPVQPFLFS